MACPDIFPSRLAVLFIDVSDGLWLISSITSQGLSVKMTLEDHIFSHEHVARTDWERKRKRGRKGKGEGGEEEHLFVPDIENKFKVMKET